MRFGLMTVVVSVLIAGAVAGVAALNGSAGGATPASAMTALRNNNDVAAADIPAVMGFPNDLRPANGRVINLAHGIFAWKKDSAVCYVDRSGTGGCFETFRTPVNATIGDDDAVGTGVPASVRGLARDDVIGVEVVLKNGQRIKGDVIGNAFEIYLPTSAAPWDVAGEDVTLMDGSIVFVPETVRSPEQLQGSAD